MSLELSDLPSAAGTLAVVAYVVEKLAKRSERADEAAEKKAAEDAKKKEDERDVLLKTVSETATRIESDMRLMMQAQGHADGRVHALEKRVDGIANDHRRRLGRLETDMTVLKTTLKIRTDADIIEEGLNDNDP